MTETKSKTPIMDRYAAYLSEHGWSAFDEFEKTCVRQERHNGPIPPTNQETSIAFLLKRAGKNLIWPIDSDELKSLFEYFTQHDELGIDDEYLYVCQVRDMLDAGQEPLRGNSFHRIYIKALDELVAKEEAEAEAEREAVKKAERAAAVGRKPTTKTGRVQLIMDTLGVARRRAYYIESDGTSNFEHCRQLAAAFAHDPKRDYPGYWQSLSRQGRPASRPSFSDYVNRGDAEFEGWPHIDRITNACSRGLIPDNAGDDLESLIQALEVCGVTPADALSIWRAGGPWRKHNN